MANSSPRCGDVTLPDSASSSPMTSRSTSFPETPSDRTSIAATPSESFSGLCRQGDESRDLCHLLTFDVDNHVGEVEVDFSEGHGPVLEALARHECLAKTVTNEDWVNLIRQLQGRRFRTSTSLPPPMGKGMRFFGKENSSSLGLLWDRRRLDLSEAFVWPSGFFAKSHFNVDSDGKTLLNGRQEALVPLEELVKNNLEQKYFHRGRSVMVENEHLPYNEVMTFVEGAEGLVGLFARSTSMMHLLWAMGIRALLMRTLPSAGELPIFVHDPERGFRPFGRSAQRMMVSEFLRTTSPPLGAADLPCVPVDAHRLGLSLQEQLELHGFVGLTEEALTALVDSLVLEGEEHDTDDHNGHRDQDAALVADRRQRRRPEDVTICSNKARGILAIGLGAAVRANNTPAALSLVQHVAPLLFATSTDGSEDPTPPPSLTMPDILALPSVENDFSRYVHGLVNDARSEAMLAMLGATVALDDFASGRMLPRIEGACRQLESWLHESSSVVFRLQSWRELNEHHLAGAESPAISSFLTHKAIRNRKAFYDDLLELEKFEEAHDVLHGMSKLQTLVTAMHHPCLRLEILRQILGLDERYDLETVGKVVAIAYHVIARVMQLSMCVQETQPPVLPTRDTGYAPLYQLGLAACHMQGLDRKGGEMAAPVPSF